jgi:hypothetical protein
MKFKELPNDAAFVFSAERNIPGYQGMRGPWAKVDKRSYVRLDHTGKGVGTCYKVGTINVDVERF